MARILEEDLHLPALYYIENENGVITTSQLSKKLRNLLNPDGEDLDILDNRTDDKFSQIVRNLTATERSFVKNGYINRESGRNKPLFITQKGKEHLKNNIKAVEYLLSNNFKGEDLLESFNKISQIDKNFESFDENLMINEGTKTIVKTKVYKRSSKLRRKAIEYYSDKDGRIKCEVCSFDFEEFYGEQGKGFIEIHHQKPVFQFDGDDLERTIAHALKNVIPVCSNCHRMIHRSRDNPLTIIEIKEHIHQEIIFVKSKNV